MTGDKEAAPFSASDGTVSRGSRGNGRSGLHFTESPYVCLVKKVTERVTLEAKKRTGSFDGLRRQGGV